MDQYKREVIQKRIEKTIQNLQRNNMKAFYVEKKEDIPAIVESLLTDGDTVTVGGSMTLFESGVIELLKSGRYNYLDRYEKGIPREKVEEIFIKAFSADAYISSSNAITEDGELYNVDGNSNRVAALLYGPKSVIIVAGYQKIVRNIDEAIVYIKQVSAPANATRLDMDTYCRHKGNCLSLFDGECGIAQGCHSPARICCNYVVSAYQRKKDRIKVIIVGEELGY